MLPFAGYSASSRKWYGGRDLPSLEHLSSHQYHPESWPRTGWDHTLQTYFYTDNESGLRVYMQKSSSASPWKWDPDRQEYYYIGRSSEPSTYDTSKWHSTPRKHRFVIHNNESRTYNTWKWDGNLRMYYFSSEGLRVYVSGPHNHEDAPRTHWDRSYTGHSEGSSTFSDVPYMLPARESNEQNLERTKSRTKGKERDVFGMSTKLPSSDQVASTDEAFTSSKTTANPVVDNTIGERFKTDRDTKIPKPPRSPRATDGLDSKAVANTGDQAIPSAEYDDTSDDKDAHTFTRSPSDQLPLGSRRGYASETGTEFDIGKKAKVTSHGDSSDIQSLPYYFPSEKTSLNNWEEIRRKLPEDWQWDIEYHALYAKYGWQHGCWTCTPLEPNEPESYPLTISNDPVVLPVEYQWPPIGGVSPPPDPRPAAPIDCRTEIAIEIVKDLFCTFKRSIGFYVLINGLLQVIVPKDFDTTWASSHLPHKYGGLKVSYIEQTLEPTMLPTRTGNSRTTSHGSSLGSPSASNMNPVVRPSAQPLANNPSLELNDFIEARPLSKNIKERFSGRIGLKVTSGDVPLLVTSTHIITGAIVAKSRRDVMFGRKVEERLARLKNNWNDHVEIWVSDKKVSISIRQLQSNDTIHHFLHDHMLRIWPDRKGPRKF